MTYEKKLEKDLPKQVKSLGGIALKFWCLSFTGFPDRMVLMPGGKIYFPELKSIGKKIKPGTRQALVRDMLIRLGFKHFEITNPQEYMAFIIILKLDQEFPPIYE